ncbi:hypothetical protein HG530_001562 [Fusarium avenaceum]|nr:hypothetical protein HG530_001562 [Fusarium avenaceum]
MVCHSIFALAALAACILEVQAGPCRPTATAVTSSVAETLSTAVPKSTLTSLATTLTEATTTSVLVSETISTTVAEPTTTTAGPPACVETQVVVNPGFDTSASDITPWVGRSYDLNSRRAYTAPNSVALVFTDGQGTARIAQTLQNLSGKYTLSFRYGSVSAQGLGAGLSCLITPKIGNDALSSAYVSESSSGWESAPQEWSAGNTDVAEAELSLSADCSGEFDQLFIYIDEITLTKVLRLALLQIISVFTVRANTDSSAGPTAQLVGLLHGQRQVTPTCNTYQILVPLTGKPALIEAGAYRFSRTKKGSTHLQFFLLRLFASVNLISMSTEQIQIDPEGDVLIILPVKKTVAEPEPPKSSKSPIEKRFICSKKHLTFASPRAAKIFSSSFKEATKQDDGFHHWKFDETFDDRAFDLVLKIIHGKTREVPQSIDLDLLVAVATVVDDLQCHEALNYYGRGWISSFYGTFGATLLKEMNKTLVQHVFVSFVFEHEGLFQHSTKAAIRFNNGAVPTFELPIRANIPRALIQGMKAAGLYPPRVSPQFPFLTLDFVINSLRNAQSPTYFSAEKGCVAGKYSGSWTLSTRSNNAPLPTGFGGFGDFGGQPRAKPSTTATSGGFGGGFGAAGFTKANSPDPTVVDQEHDPAYLVRHSCSVKDLLKPLLDVAEAEIQGLKLAAYSKS